MEEEKKSNKFKEFINTYSTKFKVGALVFLIVVILIVLMVFVSINVSPDTFVDPEKRTQFIVNSIVLIALAIYGMVFGETTGTEVSMKKSNGIYQKEFKRYKELREEVIKYSDSFPLWHEEYSAQELYKKKYDYLCVTGISDAKLVLENIDNIDLEEIKEKPVAITLDNGSIIKIKRKTEEQIDAIKYVKNGHIKHNISPSNYYLTSYDSNETSNTYLLEEGNRLTSLERENTNFNRVFAIVVRIITSVLMGMITVEAIAKGSNPQGWYDLVSRILSLVGGAWGGIMTGADNIKIRSDRYNNKAMVLELFKNAIKYKNFIPKSYEEIIKEEEEEYERKQKNDKRVQEEVNVLDTAVDTK